MDCFDCTFKGNLDTLIKKLLDQHRWYLLENQSLITSFETLNVQVNIIVFH